MKTPKSDISTTEFKLFKHTLKKDEEPIMNILKVHLLTENYLERLIHLSLPRGDVIIDEGNITYYQKVTLVKSLEVLDDAMIQSLKNLNKVRNRFSHEMNKKMTSSEVELIAKPLGKLCTKYRLESKGSVDVFLYRVLSYICGYLAGAVTTLEKEAVKEVKDYVDDKKPKTKEKDVVKS